jgi:hypothetical protein
MKFLTTILFCVLLAGCSSGDEMINVEITDWAAMERREQLRRYHREHSFDESAYSDNTKRGVVKVSEVDWNKTLSSGHWIGYKTPSNGMSYKTVDTEGVKAVSDYMK